MPAVMTIIIIRPIGFIIPRTLRPRRIDFSITIFFLRPASAENIACMVRVLHVRDRKTCRVGRRPVGGRTNEIRSRRNPSAYSARSGPAVVDLLAKPFPSVFRNDIFFFVRITNVSIGDSVYDRVSKNGCAPSANGIARSIVHSIVCTRRPVGSVIKYRTRALFVNCRPLLVYKVKRHGSSKIFVYIPRPA